MTTIRLIPQVMEFEVGIDVASMPSLFDQSLETTICAKIDEHVNNRIPDAESVAEALRESREFLRNTRDWVIESIDTDDIAQRIREGIDVDEIFAAMNFDADTLLGDSAFMRKMVEYSRFRSYVQTCVNNSLDNMNITQIVQDKIDSMSITIANDVAEKVLQTISNKLSNTDV